MSCFGSDVFGSSQNEYSRIRMVETFCSRAIRFKPICGVHLVLISYLHYFLQYFSEVVSNRRNTEYERSVGNVHKNTKSIFRNDHRKSENKA